MSTDGTQIDDSACIEYRMGGVCNGGFVLCKIL